MSAPTPPDPYRIKRILNKLETIWSSQSQERFERVFFSFYREFCDDDMMGKMSDEQFEKSLDTYLKDHKVEGWKS